MDVKRMTRSIDRWRQMDPSAVIKGSEAQTYFALSDARQDIIVLWDELQLLRRASVQSSEEQAA